MLENEYEQIVHYIEGMIADGVQLVHGGNLIDWNDTNIPELLLEINRKKEEIKDLSFESGDLLQNIFSGQKVAVINDDGKTVYLNPAEPTIKYPIDKIWHHYRKSKPGE
jgi:hypothetical protein